jgi:hypothetical protein
MRRFFALSIAVILIGAFSGCGPGTSSHADRKTDAERQQALDDSVFGTMTGTMARAKGVEQLQQDHKDKLDAAID